MEPEHDVEDFLLFDGVGVHAERRAERVQRPAGPVGLRRPAQLWQIRRAVVLATRIAHLRGHGRAGRRQRRPVQPVELLGVGGPPPLGHHPPRQSRRSRRRLLRHRHHRLRHDLLDQRLQGHQSRSGRISHTGALL